MSLDDMNDYDARAWRELEAWRERRLTRVARHFVPKAARDRFAKAGAATRDRLNQIPGAPTFQESFFKALMVSWAPSTG